MDIEFNFIEKERFSKFIKEFGQVIFKTDFDFNIASLLNDEEKEKIRNNHIPFKEIEKYYLIAEKDNQIIGWSVGHQLNRSDFFMGNSAVMPEYRNQGIYTKMLDKVVNRLKQKGYQTITSKHKMSNNAILVPKLKYGFVISGFEVSDEYGCLVELCYFTKPERKELHEIRIGTRKMNEKHLNLIR